MESLETIEDKNIKDIIHTIRNKQIILDSDLAELYEVETKRLNEQVKRNKERFPENFMFQLTKEEYNLWSQNATSSLRYQNGTLKKGPNLKYQNGTSTLKSQNATLENNPNLISQNVTSSLRSQIVTLEDNRGKHKKYLPYAFTEQGVAMLSGVLRSKKAVEVNIQIMRAFVNMRRFIRQNAEVFIRLTNLEKKHIEYDKNFKRLFDAIENKEIKQGVFFNGQVFDAYELISNLIRKAKKEIILVDNYIDDTVLTLFKKTNKDVKINILTKNITEQLRLDVKKFNSQYNNLKIKQFKESHDRFLIIDNKEIYHIGASLKDLGKKWFAFSKIETDVFKMIEKLRV